MARGASRDKRRARGALVSLAVLAALLVPAAPVFGQIPPSGEPAPGPPAPAPTDPPPGIPAPAPTDPPREIPAAPTPADPPPEVPTAPAPVYAPPPERTAPKRGPYVQELGPYRRPSIWDPEHDEYERPEYGAKDPPKRHVHEGLFARFAGGFGTARVGIDTDAQDAFTGSASGLALATEVALGFTPLRGFVLGGAIDTLTISSPNASGGPDFALTQLEQFGIYAAYFPNPRAGLSFQGGMGLAALVMGQGFAKNGVEGTRAYTAIGVGGMLGGGYEWWVSDEWGMGLLGRVLYAATSATDSGVPWTHRTLGVSILLSATYH
jgi:hypothetical protein